MCRIVEEIRSSGIERNEESTAKIISTFLGSKSLERAAEEGGVSVEKARTYLIKCGLLPANQ